MDNDTHKIFEAFVYFGTKKAKKNEEEERRLDPSCWKGYHKEGTKMKGGKRVNNCVKNENEEMPAPTFYQMLEKLKNKKELEKEKDHSEFRDQMPDSREEYSAHDYVKDMEIKGEAEEGKKKSDEEGELMKHMKERGMIDKDCDTDTGKYGKHREEEETKKRKDYVKENERAWIDSFRRTFGKGYKEEMEKGGIDPYEFYVDYYGRLYQDDVVKKFVDLYNSMNPDYPVDLEKLLVVMHSKRDKPLEGYKSTTN